jgi:hypothetical protein
MSTGTAAGERCLGRAGAEMARGLVHSFAYKEPKQRTSLIWDGGRGRSGSRAQSAHTNDTLSTATAIFAGCITRRAEGKARVQITTGFVS